MNQMRTILIARVLAGILAASSAVAMTQEQIDVLSGSIATTLGAIVAAWPTKRKTKK